MTTVSVYDINSFIKNDANITSLVGSTIDIFPTIGYGDATPPFIVYYYSPVISDVETFWHRKDAVLYSIYDVDMERMLNIGERIIELLGKGDQISQPGGVAGTDFRILSTEITDTSLEPPDERDGWYNMNLEFVIHHVKK
jgi:hypothetical protein